jgi:hypothetical protein
MRLVAQPVTDLRHVEACTASMRGWVIAVLAWFCEVIDTMPAWAWRYAIVRDAYAAAKRGIAANLRWSTHYLRLLIFLRAHAEFRFTTGRIQPHKFARGARPGVRLGAKRRRHYFRAITAGVVANMHEGSLRDRAKRLNAMLNNPARLVARVLKRLHAIWRHPHGQGLVLTASRELCTSLASPAQIAADSS